MSANIDKTKYETEWATTPAQQGKTFETVKDGTYTAQIEKAYFNVSKSSQRDMLTMEMRILGPDEIGRKLWRHTILEKNMGWLKKDLETLGVRLEKFSDFFPDDISGVHVRVTLKTRNGYQAIYIDERLDSAVIDAAMGTASASAAAQGGTVGSPAGDGAQAAITDEDLPF